MLTFEKGADESYISQFIKTKEWANPIYGDISPIYSMLKVGDIVNIISLPIVDAYSLYDPMKRLVRVKSKKGNSKYIVVCMDNECEDDFEITVNRTDAVSYTHLLIRPHPLLILGGIAPSMIHEE